jgi:hypothetical protein
MTHQNQFFMLAAVMENTKSGIFQTARNGIGTTAYTLRELE